MTLTETAALTKKIILFGAIFLVVATGAFLGYKYYKAYQAARTPPPEEKPDVKFGKLPKPALGKISSSKFVYSLDTKTGGLPQNLPKIFKVYFIPLLGTTLLAPEKAQELAQNLRFPDEPQIISNNEYLFTSKDGKLLVDLPTGNFSFERVVSTESSQLQDDVIASEDKLADEFKSFLSEKLLLKDQLKNGKTGVVYDDISRQKATKASIFLWQENVDDLPLVTETFNKGLIESQVSKFRDEEARWLKLKYTFWQIDKNSFATYPIKGADKAFSELKQGGAYVLLETKKQQVSITSVYLGYLLTEKYQPYLIPYFVFEGDRFAAIVPAILEEYIQ